MTDEEKVALVAAVLAKRSAINGGLLGAEDRPKEQFLDSVRVWAPKTYQEIMRDAAAILSALEQAE